MAHVTCVMNGKFLTDPLNAELLPLLCWPVLAFLAVRSDDGIAVISYRPPVTAQLGEHRHNAFAVQVLPFSTLRPQDKSSKI